MLKDRPPALLTIDEAAAELRISRSVFYELLNKGEIRSVYLHRRLRRIEPAALDEFIARNRAETC